MKESKAASGNTRRKAGWDLFRIFLVIVVFAFHANMHLGLSFGVFTGFVTAGSLCMSGFFMLSGAVLYYKYGNERAFNDELKSFYLKRFFSIMPLYWTVTVLFILDNTISTDEIKFLPIEIIGLQSLFPVDFYMLHNGGTWFVSCLLICYAVFPLLGKILNRMNKPQLIVICFLLTVLDIYALLITYRLGFVEMYSTPFSRCLQFAIGCTVSALLKEQQQCGKKWPASVAVTSSVMILALLIITATKMVERGMFLNTDILQKLAMYDVMAVPCFIVLIYILGSLEANIGGKLLVHASNLAYAFFLAQLFIWERAKWAFAHFEVHNKILRIMIAFVMCLTVAAVMHFCIEKPCNLLINRERR